MSAGSSMHAITRAANINFSHVFFKFIIAVPKNNVISNILFIPKYPSPLFKACKTLNYIPVEFTHDSKY